MGRRNKTSGVAKHHQRGDGSKNPAIRIGRAEHAVNTQAGYERERCHGQPGVAEHESCKQRADECANDRARKPFQAAPKYHRGICPDEHIGTECHPPTFLQVEGVCKVYGKHHGRDGFRAQLSAVAAQAYQA